MWSGTVISLFFVAFRVFVRIKSFRRIYADDVIVIIAWLMFLASAVIWQSQQKAMYEQFILSAGTVIPTPEQLAAERKFLRSQVATVGIYYTSLWMVKLSFLVFFRRLGQNVRGQRIWWWCVTGFTVATWVTCIGSMGFKCLLRSLDYIFGRVTYSHTETTILKYCSQMRKPICTKFSMGNSRIWMCSRRDHRCSKWVFLHYCSTSQLKLRAVITIPVLMLWNVRISWRKKLALMSIFSLTIIVIVFSIVRVVVVSVRGSTADITWLYLWSNIEVVVCTFFYFLYQLAYCSH